MDYCQQMWFFSCQTSEISADKNLFFLYCRKNCGAVWCQTQCSQPVTGRGKKRKRLLLSLQRAESVTASTRNFLPGTPGHVSTFLLVGGELLAYVSGFPVQEISLALEATCHSGRKEEDSGLFTWWEDEQTFPVMFIRKLKFCLEKLSLAIQKLAPL